MDRDGARSWAHEEFGSAELGDARRKVRLIAMATEACLRPNGRISAVFEDNAARQGAYDFVESPHIRPEAVGAAIQRACLRRASGHAYVFVPVDGSSLTLADVQRAKNFGSIGAHVMGARGLKVVDALAVAPDGTPLGIAGMRWWARTVAPRRTSCPRNPKVRETMHWVKTVHEVAKAFDREAPGTKAWFQIDREGDGYHVLKELASTGHLFTVRSNGTRKLRDPLDRKLRSYVSRLRPMGSTLLEVPETAHRKARLACMAIRARKVTLDLRNNWSKSRTALTLTVLQVREVGRTPAGEKPLEWLLLTNYDVQSVADAEHVAFGYSQRWRIEDFHRTWKRGACNVEDTQLRRRDHVITWATLLAAVAVRIERLKHLSREQPERPASDELSPAEIQALILLKRRRKKRTETISDEMPTIAKATLWIAELGGYTGKSSGGPPGSITIGRGFERLRMAAEVIELLEPRE